MKKISFMNIFLILVIFTPFNEINSQNRQQTIKKYNPLHRAILDGSVSSVKKYSIPRYFYYSDSNTEMPLELAFRKNRMDLAKIMIRRGLRVDRKDYFGETVIFKMACSPKWLKLLMSAGAAKNQKSANLGNQSLLQAAARCPGSESVKFLIQRKAYLESKDVSKSTPLMSAVNFGRLENARALIKAGARMEYRHGQEKTDTLTVAIANNDPAMVKLLLNSLHRVRPYTDRIYRKLTGSKSQAGKKQEESHAIEIFKLLRKRKLSLTPVKEYTCQAFSFEPSLARYWIDNIWKMRGWKLGAYRHKYGTSMLQCTRQKEDMKWLLGRGRWDVSPLPLFADREDLEEVRSLLESGYDVNGRDNHGRSALFYTGRKNFNHRITDLLIEKGASVNLRDNKGDTIYSTSLNSIKTNPDYVEKLLKAGFDPRIKNGQGKTAIDMAREECRGPLRRSYSSEFLENCVKSLSLLTGEKEEQFIPEICNKPFSLSKYQKGQYVKRSDGYYYYRFGKWVKHNPDTCGKYRQFGQAKKETLQPYRKEGYSPAGRWKIIGKTSSFGYTKKGIGAGRWFFFNPGSYAGKKWQIEFETMGVFKNVLILGSEKKGALYDDFRIIYEGTSKTISSKDMKGAAAKYSTWIIKMNGTKEGFYNVKGMSKVRIKSE